MTNSHPLDISPDVAEVVPPEALARWREDPGYESLTCHVCDQLIATGQPAAVFVTHDPVLDLWHMGCTHPDCRPSVLIEADLSNLAAPPGGHDVRISAGLATTAFGEPEPFILVEPTMSYATTGGPDLIDMWIEAGLANGLRLVSNVSLPLGVARKRGWKASLSPILDSENYALRIECPDGTPLVSSGNVYAPWSVWGPVVAQHGNVRLLVATSLTNAMDTADPSVLARLAAAGRLAGALIPAVIG